MRTMIAVKNNECETWKQNFAVVGMFYCGGDVDNNGTLLFRGGSIVRGTSSYVDISR
jgi:hypothetical protein